jgi:hypothetical protein
MVGQAPCYDSTTQAGPTGLIRILFVRFETQLQHAQHQLIPLLDLLTRKFWSSLNRLIESGLDSPKCREGRPR